jgi:polysaccharide deacetylase 2 family uncharacterized protein YibQ
VARDDLYAPLGLDKKPARARLSPLVYSAAAGLLGVALAAFVIWIVVGHDPFGGEPMALAKTNVRVVEPNQAVRLRLSEPDPTSPESTGAISPAEEIAQLKALERAKEKTLDQAAGRAEQTVTIIDGRSGARQEVKIPAPAAPAEPTMAAGIDARLAEMTRDGPIPRVGANGMRAAQAYAQPSGAKPNAPQIAIVVTGIGISNATSAEALNKLPPAVTFALAPGGTDLERLAGKARSLGHELLLQVPMEPSEQPPDGNSPQALLTSLSPDQNIERLHWLMSRFQGYVGIANQMGGRLTASEAAFAPILRDIGSRGLIYVDDGSSPKSLAGQIAGSGGSGFARANLVLDAVPSSVEIDRALAKLEGMARQNGMAIGFATAWPVVIERIARWSKAVEGRGFSLVPITAAAARGKPS